MCQLALDELLQSVEGHVPIRRDPIQVRRASSSALASSCQMISRPWPGRQEIAKTLDPSHQGAILTAVSRLVDRGLLRAQVSARVSLPEVAEGHRQIETGRTIGKVAVLVAP